MSKTILIFLISVIPFFCLAQEKDKYDEKYEWRIRQENLYGVYIPRDVNDALIQLNRLIDDESRVKYKELSEEEVSKKLFFSLGRWITYNWSLYNGSRLSIYMQDMGIHHPDHMAGFLMIAYHRNLNKKPLEIKALIHHFQEKEKKEKEEKLKKGTIIYEEKRQRERPAENKNGG